MEIKTLTLADLELDNSLELIKPEELAAYTGGTTENDCVINVFNYLDGTAFDYQDYLWDILHQLGYDPEVEGGVYTSDIPTIGGFGSMAVRELTGSGGFAMLPNGTIPETGERIMMTFNTGPADHAVVVTGSVVEDGVTYLTYFDPTTGTTGQRESGNYTSLYAVGMVGSLPN